MATWSWMKTNKIEVKHTVGHSIHNSTVWCSQKIIWRSDRKYLRPTDEITAACSPISLHPWSIQNYYHALEHILLLYWHWHGHVRVSNKSEVKEKDKPIYVLDKKTLDILPPPSVVWWCDVVACVHNQVLLCVTTSSRLSTEYFNQLLSCRF